MKKKSIVMLAATVVTTASVAIGGTLAYLTSADSLKNTFSMGGPGGDGDFSINLQEHELATNGTILPGGTAPVWTLDEGLTGEDQTYENVLPNVILPKDPRVTNEGSFDMWTRIQVTLPGASYWAAANDIADLTATGAPAALAAKVFLGTPNSFTVVAAYDDDSNVLTVSYLYNTLLAAKVDNGDDPVTYSYSSTPAAFSSVKIPNFDNDQFASVIGDDKEVVLDVTAQSIQTDSTFTTVELAMDAYDGINTPATPV